MGGFFQGIVSQPEGALQVWTAGSTRLRGLCHVQYSSPNEIERPGRGNGVNSTHNHWINDESIIEKNSYATAWEIFAALDFSRAVNKRQTSNHQKTNQT
jgi:hypothetical protein